MIGLLPMSQGKDAILNIVDHYMKQIHLFPVTTQLMADGVTSIYFEQVFLLHGIPKKIIKDVPCNKRTHCLLPTLQHRL
jgi:hypothetical protein